MTSGDRGITRRSVQRARDGLLEGDTDDVVVVEEPLEIRLAGEPLAVTMRTPGSDRELTIGFLHAEGLIASADDLGSVSHCGRPGDEGYGNVIDAVPAAGLAIDPESLSLSRRGTLTTAACGVCGRRSVDDLLARCAALPPGPAVALEVVTGAPARLHDAQPEFARTGGSHAALVLSAEGELLAGAEDVGRHNAVDKVIGALLLRPPDRPAALLMVSGRVSFEIVQKAVVARIPLVAGVSAPTSLAVDLADRARVTLAGFVRSGRLNLYTHAERIG